MKIVYQVSVELVNILGGIELGLQETYVQQPKVKGLKLYTGII